MPVEALEKKKIETKEKLEIGFDDSPGEVIKETRDEGQAKRIESTSEAMLKSHGPELSPSEGKEIENVAQQASKYKLEYIDARIQGYDGLKQLARNDVAKKMWEQEISKLMRESEKQQEGLAQQRELKERKLDPAKLHEFQKEVLDRPITGGQLAKFRREMPADEVVQNPLDRKITGGQLAKFRQEMTSEELAQNPLDRKITGSQLSKFRQEMTSEQASERAAKKAWRSREVAGDQLQKFQQEMEAEEFAQNPLGRRITGGRLAKFRQEVTSEKAAEKARLDRKISGEQLQQFQRETTDEQNLDNRIKLAQFQNEMMEDEAETARRSVKVSPETIKKFREEEADRKITEAKEKVKQRKVSRQIADWESAAHEDPTSKTEERKPFARVLGMETSDLRAEDKKSEPKSAEQAAGEQLVDAAKAEAARLKADAVIDYEKQRQERMAGSASQEYKAPSKEELDAARQAAARERNLRGGWGKTFGQYYEDARKALGGVLGGRQAGPESQPAAKREAAKENAINVIKLPNDPDLRKRLEKKLEQYTLRLVSFDNDSDYKARHGGQEQHAMELYKRAILETVLRENEIDSDKVWAKLEMAGGKYRSQRAFEKAWETIHSYVTSPDKRLPTGSGLPKAEDAA